MILKPFILDMTHEFKKEVDEHGLQWVLDKLKSLGVINKIPVYLEKGRSLTTGKKKPIIDFKRVKVGDILAIAYYKKMKRYWAEAVVVHKYNDVVFYKFLNDKNAPKGTHYAVKDADGWNTDIMPLIVRIKPYQYIADPLPKFVKVEIVEL